MISFHDPNFYEKIIKKYGRRIRKSYFSNLFLKQDFISSVPGNTRISFSIKLNFYNTLLRKKFSLSSHKEKQPGYSVFVPEFKFSASNPPEPVREKSISLKLKLKKNEPFYLKNRLIHPGFLSFNFTSPEPITSGFSSFNPISPRLVNHKIKTSSLQSSKLRLFDITALDYTYFNNHFANPTSPNLKFFMPEFFENNCWIPFIKIGDQFNRSGFKIVRNCKNFFLKENSLFFLHSRLPTVNGITFRKVSSAAEYSALPFIPTPAANDFSRNIRNEVLRKIESLKFSGRTRTDSIRVLNMNFTPSVPFLKNFLEKNAFFLYWKYSVGSESDKTSRNTTHERQKVVSLEPYVHIFKQQTGIIAQPGAGTYEKILSTSVMKQIRSLQTVLRLSSFFNLRSDSVNQKVRAFNWLTVLTYNAAGISQLNRQGTSTAGNIVSKQFNPQKSYKPENAVFASYFHDMIQPMREALDYAKIHIFSSAFRYLEFQKPASEIALMTSNLAVDYQLPDSYVAYYHTAQNQKLDSKRELKRGKKYYFGINRPQSILRHHLFLKSPEMTVSRVKSPETIQCISGKKVPGKLSKSPFILQKIFLQEDVPAFPYTYIKRTSKLFSFIRNLLFFNKNGILSIENASSGSASTFQDIKSKYITNFHENISKEKIHFYGQFQLQKIFELLKLPVLLHTASTTDGDNKAYSQRIQATRAYKSTVICTPEQPVYCLSDHQIADHYTASSQKVEYKRELKMKKRRLFQINRLNSKLIQPFFVRSPEKITYRLKRVKSLLYSDTRIFTSSDTSIPMCSLQNAHIFSFLQNLPLNIKLSTPSHTGKHPDTAALSYPITSTQKYPEDVAFNCKKTYPFEYSTTLIRNLKVSAINYLAIHSSIMGKLLHSSATLNKDHLERRTILEKRTVRALSGLSHSFLKKTIPHIFSSRAFLSRNILKLFKIKYSPSRTNMPAVIEYFTTLSNKQNFVSKGTFSSNSLFSEISSNASVALLSETFGITFGKKSIQFFNLMKHADSIIFQSPVFTEKPVSSSDKEARSSNAGAQVSKIAIVSRFTGIPKLNGQNVQHWKAARMNLLLGSGKRGYGNAGDFPQRGSANFLRRENSSWQVNKKQDDNAAPRKVQRISSNFILSTMPDFVAEMKWKKVFSSIYGPEKKPGDKKAVSKNISLRSRDLQSFKNSSKFSVDPESRNTYFTLLSLKGKSGTSPDSAAFRTSRKERSELMHAERSIHKIGREDLVYETSEPLFEEVKKIKRIIFETREIVADHLEFHMPQVAGKPEQVMDIEDMSEKIMQVINCRLKIESERRGIF